MESYKAITELKKSKGYLVLTITNNEDRRDQLGGWVYDINDCFVTLSDFGELSHVEYDNIIKIREFKDRLK